MPLQSTAGQEDPFELHSNLGLLASGQGKDRKRQCILICTTLKHHYLSIWLANCTQSGIAWICIVLFNGGEVCVDLPLLTTTPVACSTPSDWALSSYYQSIVLGWFSKERKCVCVCLHTYTRSLLLSIPYPNFWSDRPFGQRNKSNSTGHSQTGSLAGVARP